MNDLHLASDLFSIISYADDTTLVGSIKKCLNSGSKLTETVNAEIVKVCDWLAVNKLSLNVTKTKAMIFSKPSKQIPDIDFTINNKLLEQVPTFKFLGLTIDNQLNWKAHLNKVANKVSKSCGILAKLKRRIPEHVLSTIYNSLILPQLSYALLCWGFSDLSGLSKLQKKAVRLITNSRYKAHTEPLFKSQNILKIDDMFYRYLLKFVYQFKNNLLPPFFQSFKYTSSHSINTRYKVINDRYKEYTKKRVRSGLFELINLQKRPKNSKYSNDVCCSQNSDKVSKFISSNYDCLLNCLNKISTHSQQGFMTYIKVTFISHYSDKPCSKINCFPCGR